MCYRISFAIAVAAFACSSCSRDLVVPPIPERAQVSGTLDTQGKIPANDNVVVLVSEEGARVTQQTSSAGQFVFADLLPGLYYLEVNLPGFAPFLRPNVRLRGGDRVDLGSIAPTWLAGTPQEAVVTGRVVAASDGDTAGGQVEFLLQPVGSRIALAAVGLNGLFVQRVPPGTYKLRASHPLYVTTESSAFAVGEAEQADLTAAPLTLDINPATLAGQVLRERDGDTPVPAAGALLTLSNGITTTADPSGNIFLTGLAAGPFTLRLTLADYHDEIPARAVQFSPGETTTADTVTLKLDRGTIAGTVELADRQPARDVTVSLTGTPYSAVVSPDATEPHRGSFRISGVPVGVYEVAASKARYSRAAVPTVTVRADQTTPVGLLTLTLLQGDFIIEDGDSQNTAGYTRTTGVSLNLASFSAAAEYRASEDSTFTGVSFQPFTGGTSKPFTLADTQGTHTVYAQYKDASGTESPVFAASIVYDSVPPANAQATLAGGAEFTNVANPLVITLDAQDVASPGVDSVSGLAYVRMSTSSAVDAGGVLLATRQSYQRDMLFTRPTSGDGQETVYVQFEDHAGNVSAVVSDRVVIDTVRPAGSIAIADGPRATVSGFTHQALVDLSQSVAAEPNGGYVLIKLANSQAALNTAVLQPVVATSAWFLDPSTNGLKTVYALLQDAAGNTSLSTLSATITYDATPPSPVTATLVGPSTTSAAQVTLALSAQDDTQLSPTQALTVSEDAFFQGAGTVGPQPYPGNNQITYPLSSDQGLKQIYVRFRDAAGNDSMASVRVTRDTLPPSGSFTVAGALADGTPSSLITSTANVTVTLNHSGATEYALGNETLVSCATASYLTLDSTAVSHTLSGSASPRVVSLCLRDAAGNTTGPLTQTIALDTSVPAGCAASLAGYKVDGTAAPAGKTGTSRVSVTLSGCTETPAEVFFSSSAVTCTAGAAFAWQPYSASLAFFLPGPDGTNSVAGCVRDAARNVGSITAGAITLDTTPPSSPLVVLDSGADYVNGQQYTTRGGYIASAQGSATGATEWSINQTPSFTVWSNFATTNPQNFTFAGAGTRTLYAVFRDEVGNTSAVATDSITFDITAPSISGVTLRLNQGNAYINSVAVMAEITGAGSTDAVQMQVALAAGGSCQVSDFAATLAEPFSASPFIVLLSSGDGLKRVCARLIDAAGNTSGIINQAITLDTVPPTAPIIVTPPAVVNASQVNPYVVTTAGAVTETNFSRYEQVGGQDVSWRTTSTNINNTTFNFNLTRDDNLEAGRPNTLQIRAVDLAGNVSPSDSVVIIKDTRAPSPVTTNARWTSNGNQTGSVYWQASSSPDVVAHHIYYGSATGSYDGVYADQGPSPIQAPGGGVFTLSGLINGSPTYVSVRPVDHAGNEGSAPVEVLLEPNVVSPTRIADLSVTGYQYWERFAVQDDRLYAVSFKANSGCGAASHQPALHVIDLSQLVSPVQTGTPVAAPPSPTVVATLLFPDVVSCYDVAVSGRSDLAVDGRWAFVAAGTKLYIVDILNPNVPVNRATLDFGTLLQGIQVRGDVLFLSGGSSTSPVKVVALNLAKLYDGNATTFPTTTDTLGTATNGGMNPSGLVWSRNMLIEASDLSAYQWSVVDALDGNGATVWDNTDRIGIGSIGYSSGSPNPVAFGNALFQVESNRIALYDLVPIWSGGLLSSSAVTASLGLAGRSPFDVRGAQLFFQDNQAKGVRVVDFTDLNSVADHGLMRTDPYSTGFANITYGNYLINGDVSQLVFAEIATPRSLRQVAVGTSGMPRNTLRPGMLVGGGTALDLLAPWPLQATAPDTDNCFYDDANFGEVSVQAQGARLRVTNLEDSTDRDATTPFDASDSYNVTLPAGTVATGMATFGNKLVVAEIRGDGTYLEVFNANPILDRQPGTSLTLANSLGAYRVTTTTAARAQVSLHRGRALVTLDNETNVSNMGLYVVDIRPLLDDDSSTSMTAQHYQGYAAAAATGNPSLFAGHRQSVGRGNYAYVAGAAGLEIIDISAAMDENLGTTIPASPSRALVPMRSLRALAVHGSYAIVVPLWNGLVDGIVSVDVSNPLSPQRVSALPFYRDVVSCIPQGMSYPDGLVNSHAGISVGGSRAYITAIGYNAVLELE